MGEDEKAGPSTGSGRTEGEGAEVGLPRPCGSRNDGQGADGPPSREASADKPPALGASADKGGERIQPGRNRELQVQRAGGRKLFDEAAQAVFLEWFAATCNFVWSAEMAGFNYKTVMRHRMNDPRFREGCDRAVEQGYARVEAKRLETRKKQLPIGIEGDWDAPEMDEMSPERMDAILRQYKLEAKHPELVRRQGRRPRIASNAEVREALAGRLKAFRDRVRARTRGGGRREDGSSLPLHGGGQVGVELPPGTEGAENPPPPPKPDGSGPSSPIEGEGEE